MIARIKSIHVIIYTNVDIYDTYASTDEENYFSKFTCTLINPTEYAAQRR